jgi:release factor glutamine methyltransferase
MTHYCIKGVDLSIEDHTDVYPPAEDTFLLLESAGPGARRVLEIGTGSGIIAIYCARKGAAVTATDINPQAVRLARRNAALNGVDVEVVRADIFEGIEGAFDTIIFNPPYLPTAPEDMTGDRWLDASVSGGPDGLDVVRRFLSGLGERLAPGGRAYVLTSSHSGPTVPIPRHFTAREIASLRLEFETLRVHEIARGQGPWARDRGRKRATAVPSRARRRGGRGP